MAEDVIQDAALHACVKYQSAENSIHNVDAWLSKLAFNIFIQHQRKKKRYEQVLKTYSETWPVSQYYSTNSPLKITEKDRNTHRLSHALAKLPQPLRQIVQLSLQGFSYLDMSEILGISEMNARKKMQLAKCKLRLSMNDISNRS